MAAAVSRGCLGRSFFGFWMYGNRTETPVGVELVAATAQEEAGGHGAEVLFGCLCLPGPGLFSV